jgi:1-acylglycerone phosphate reductase
MDRKSVLITGCKAGGIGNSLAKEFHSKGLLVFATARDRNDIVDLATLGIETISLDVLSPEAVVEARKRVEAVTGAKGLDYLVNNAGMNYTVPALEVDFDDVAKVFNTNVFSVMRITKEFMPLLIKAKGTVVQIGSVAGVVPYVFGCKCSLGYIANC